MVTRRNVLGMMSSLPLAGMASPLAAQGAWPNRPVKILVPFAAGGNTDGLSRLMAQWLSDRFNQQFAVENRPGANGSLAVQGVTRAPPDGYTLIMAAVAQIAIFPAMTTVPYDAVKELAPISNVGMNPFALMVSAKLPVTNVRELVDYVKAQPKTVAYASGGTGSLSHLSMVLFLQRAGLKMDHVPYRGGGPAIADLVAGHVPMYFGNLSEALPHAGGNAIRVLAISDEKRSKLLPNVPTVAEAIFPGFKTVTWNGLLTTAGTPPDIIDTIAREVQAALRDKAILSKLESLGVDPVGDTPAAFAKTIGEDIKLWAEAVKIADVKL
jgi:tripartite-type tricarboxylate transporter receptor subunit TctC